MQRNDGRSPEQLRPLTITYNLFGYAASSVFYELGGTKVLCSITLTTGVPHFLKGKKVGWLTAEYAMLPTATATRTQRESENGKRNGRSVEISRLIGRSLRTMVNLDLLGERTITIDCDVLQADGGTRTACITAASLALEAAQHLWLEKRIIQEPILTDRLCAISIGLRNGTPLVDMNYQEDSSIDADFNIVMTASGKLIEIQGSAEKQSYTWEQFDAVRGVAQQAIKQLLSYGSDSLQSVGIFTQDSCEPVQQQESHATVSQQPGQKLPLFSLKNRLQNSL